MEHAELVSLLGKNDAFDTAPPEELEKLVAAAELPLDEALEFAALCSAQDPVQEDATE